MIYNSYDLYHLLGKKGDGFFLRLVLSSDYFSCPFKSNLQLYSQCYAWISKTLSEPQHDFGLEVFTSQHCALCLWV